MNESRREWLLAYNLAHRIGRQHRGPLTGRTIEVLDVLLEVEEPISYAEIADRVARRYGSCCRDTVAVAVKMLRATGLLAWDQRSGPVRRHEKGKPRYRFVRLQNAYRLLDPS